MQCLLDCFENLSDSVRNAADFGEGDDGAGDEALDFARKLAETHLGYYDFPDLLSDFRNLRTREGPDSYEPQHACWQAVLSREFHRAHCRPRGGAVGDYRDLGIVYAGFLDPDNLLAGILDFGDQPAHQLVMY